MRTADSHKGDNGIVAVIGGSRSQHGAPLFSALAAEASGVDLLHVWIPSVHEEVTKNASFNFQVHTFGTDRADEISGSDRERMIEHLATIDAVVIGPGLSRSASNVKSIMNLLAEVPCPVVADASALQHETLKALTLRHAVVTPHLGELERMGYLRTELPTLAKKHACTILLKSSVDTGATDRKARIPAFNTQE
jgi:NAD(P)H-hydrate epimerase